MKANIFKFRCAILLLPLISAGIYISAQIPQMEFINKENKILLGPWKCRSAATSNKWINGGYYPRANDLFGPLKWDDTSIRNNAKLGEMDWNFQTTFHLPAKKYLHYRLHFGQSAIYDQIRLNNIAIHCNRYLPAGMASFCGFDPDLYPALLKDSNNVLRINHFTPFDPERRSQYALENSCRIKDNDTSGFAAAVRVPPYQSGWDIAPRRITVGLDEGVFLEGWNHFRVNHFSVQTVSANTDSAIITFFIKIETDTITKLDLKLYAPGLYYSTIYGYKMEYGINEIRITKTVLKPKLWWPNGMYQQKQQKKPFLYNAYLQISQPGDTILLSRKFGIRTIDLIQQKDSIGESFYFLVNNKAVFIKGLNLVPTRGFMSYKTHDSLWKSGIAMQRIADANVNLVRVWGGGGYEEDWFYDACDSLGLLVWQDFMYSGMMYVSRCDQNLEAEYHVNRLAGHPCMALWCGNNEISIAWKNWGWQNKYKIHGNDSIFLWNEYRKIFEHTLPDIVKRTDLQTPYLASSPVSNWGNETDLRSGDNHYWAVWHGEKPIRDLRKNIPRFASEWGLPSYPLSGFKGAGMVVPDSATYADLDHRLLSYKGAKLMHRYTDSFYAAFPDQDNNSVYAGSLQSQSNALLTGVRAHRMNRPNCMGTIWWQFNDIWPGTTWSIMDFGGAPKPAYFQLKYAFENLMVYREINDPENLELLYANDGWSDSTITIGIYAAGNLKNPLVLKNITVKKESAGNLFKINYSELNALLQNEKDRLVIRASCNNRPIATIRYENPR